MKKNLLSLLVLLFIALTTWSIFYFRMPQDYSRSSEGTHQFSTERALKHIAKISEKPHFVGSPYHDKVTEYLTQELEKLGLTVTKQKSTILSKWGNLVTTENVLTRIKGSNNSKALLLLTHYDSAPHSNSYGASDDANGLGTILEGIRTFLHNKTPHKNDIIILFSDGEELGLNGAYAFSSEHPWAEEVGLVINFEARGTSGPSMMLAETNQGNAALIDGFSEANPDYPVSNSLMYSVYKMLPNDTDLTAFREQKNIPGFNLAFIDDHFNYHTEQDDYAHITPECIEHQASYLMPMLEHFSNADLAALTTDKDLVYWNSLFGFFSYPFGLNWVLFGLCFILWVGLGFLGFGNRSLSAKMFLQGIFKFVGLLIVTTASAYGLWQLILFVYPSYQDMLHGFTYNGHAYMAAFVLLSICLSFVFYKKLDTNNVISYHFASLFVWLIVLGLLITFLPGAGFLTIPVLYSLLSFGLIVFQIKYSKPLFFIFSLSTLVILVPLIQMFPIGLGLKILPGSVALVVLAFGLMLPLFSLVTNKLKWAFVLLIASGGFLVQAHLQSDFEPGKAKFNSLTYLYQTESGKAFWTTYDQVLDDWTTTYMGENPQTAQLLNHVSSSSKYNNGFSFMVDAPKIDLKRSNFYFKKDTLIGNFRHISIEIVPNRPLNRMDIFADETLDLYHFKANGIRKINQVDSLLVRKGKTVVSYYPLQNEPLTLDFVVQKNADLEFTLRETSFDLLQNVALRVPARPKNYIPMPFVLNDAITLEQIISLEKSDPIIIEENIETEGLEIPLTESIELPQTVTNTSNTL
uniref:M28 family peptidase n=1 Tax=Flavobacterium sp. TaxID=239 RepID=UPI0040497E0F